MIQRVQSIFLFIMALLMIGYLFVPIWSKGHPETKEIMTINALNVLKYTPGQTALLKEVMSTHWHIPALSILSAVIALFSIFSYKNRMRQIKLGALNALFVLVVVVSAVWVINTNEDAFLPQTPGNYQIGFFIPIMAVLMNSLANRFIRRDERLVRESNRIR